MLKLNHTYASSSWGRSVEIERMAHAINALFSFLRALDWYVKRRAVYVGDVRLTGFAVKPATGWGHSIHCLDGGDFIDEIAEWRVWVRFGDKGQRSFMVRHVFRTQMENRSGSSETTFDGLPHIKPESGGWKLPSEMQDWVDSKKEPA